MLTMINPSVKFRLEKYFFNLFFFKVFLLPSYLFVLILGSIIEYKISTPKLHITTIPAR